jgi:hypothetical protein
MACRVGKAKRAYRTGRQHEEVGKAQCAFAHPASLVMGVETSL